MDLTVQIVTRNNAKTIIQVIESVKPLDAYIVVGDLGSTDNTVSLLENEGVSVVRYQDQDASMARNDLLQHSKTEWQLFLNPWEVISQGYEQIKRAKDNCYVTVLNETVVTKEIRLWKNREVFCNPVYEYLEATAKQEIGLVIYAIGTPDLSQNLPIIERWMKDKPLAKETYYYKALTLLSQRRYDEFLKVSEHYMFLDKSSTVPSVMNRYYFSLIQIIHKKRVKPALQNINLCLCVNPLMAEFWCLQGDVYYHLLRDYALAKEYYEIALILGKRRLTNDKWPMDISKYDEYPKKMIASCDYLLDV